MTDPNLPYARSNNPAPVPAGTATELLKDPATGALSVAFVPGGGPIQEVVITIDRTADGFPALLAGVKTFLKTAIPALPAGAKFLGGYVDPAGWVDFTSGANPLVTVEAQAFVAGDLWGAVTVSTGGGPFPATGAPGSLGFTLYPVGGGSYAVLLTSAVDLNTLTQGHVVVRLFWSP